jgi:3',5'-cyclic AMP phosphodiesterase CpdA
LFISSAFQQAKSQETVYPNRIMLTIPGNPATSRAISWCTAFGDSVSIGEIAPVDAAPTLEQNMMTVTGTFTPWEKGSQTAMGHKVFFENLKPNTKYAYRVGDNKNWSEWFQFKTSSDKAEPFSFLYFGDVQNEIKSYGSRTLRQAYTHFPDADFMLFAGDLVKVSQEEDWREFFYAGGWIFGMMPSVPTPGNHEYDKQENQSRSFSKHWNQIFTMPLNGPSEKFNNRFYYIDYQGVRFVSVDSPAYGEDSKDDEMILGWLDKTLANNPNRWAVVFTHYPVYYCCQDRDKKQYQVASKTILEKYGVDIVLQGHDHTYCRGQNLTNAEVNSKNHPMYIVSVAGEKMYGLNTSFWSDRVASNTQLYQNIAFNGDTLSYKSFTVAGELYDEFLLIKNKAGINHFIESKEVRGIDQRTEIPKGEEEKYTDKEMQKYRQKFQKK